MLSEIYLIHKIIAQGERMSQQLTDLQNAVASLQTEDATLVAAVTDAVTELIALEAKLANLPPNTDTAALEGIATTVNSITASLTTAVAQLAAAAPATPAPAV